VEMRLTIHSDTRDIELLSAFDLSMPKVER
jgi:hypothetical protein